MTNRYDDASPKARELLGDFDELDLAEMLATTQAAIARVRTLADRWAKRTDQLKRGAELLTAALDGTPLALAGLDAQSEPDTTAADDLTGYTAPGPPIGCITVAAEPAPAGLREQIAAALYAHEWRPVAPWDKALAMDQEVFLAQADAVLAVILPTTRLTAELARQAEADVQRVIALYERWVKAGPPPIGTSISRWWDTRLAELAIAINPPKEH